VDRNLFLRTGLVSMAALLVHGLVVLAQMQKETPPGKYTPKAQWQKDLDENKPTLGMVAGQSTTIVPGLLVRRRQAGPNNASVHTAEGDKQDVTEIYEIVDGSGTYVTGGTMPDPNNRTAGIKGGEAHDVKPGDFIVIPPGTAHWFSKINDHITYVETRFPGNVLTKK
jgi:mannose-6-phosphate isomerase-like protein (cupin superfamily)